MERHMAFCCDDNYLIPACYYREDLQRLPYAEKADLLNVALFGFTHRDGSCGL